MHLKRILFNSVSVHLLFLYISDKHWDSVQLLVRASFSNNLRTKFDSSNHITHVAWRPLYWRAALARCFSPSCGGPGWSCEAPSRRPAPGRTSSRTLPASLRSAPLPSPWRAAGWRAPAAPGRLAAWTAAPAGGCVGTCLWGWQALAGRGRRAGTLSARLCPGFDGWGPPALNSEWPRWRSPGLETETERQECLIWTLTLNLVLPCLPPRLTHT